MALVSSKNVGTNREELIVEVKGEVFAKAVERSVKKNTKQITIPGFRKGKAPRAMIERMYGKGVFYEDAVNDVYPAAYEEAVRDAGIEPVDAAEVEIVEVDDNGVTFKATVTTKPVPELGAYKGVSAPKAAMEITEKDVDDRVSAMQQRYARLVPVEDRAAQKGDLVTIDFEGFVDGVAFEGGKGENYDLELGSGTFIPGFEEQVENRSAGEEFDVNVTFPEDYGEPTLAGKPAVFKCKLHAIKFKELPELDDEFAKDISEFETFAAYRDDLKAKMVQGSEEQARVQYENALLAKVVADLKVEIPECMIRSAINDCLNDYGMRLGQQGLTLDDFIRYTGQTREQFAETFRPQATDQVKARLALEAIAKAEGLTAADEEIGEQYDKMAEEYKLTAEQLRQYIPEADVRGDLLCRKAMQFIVDNGAVEEASEENAAADGEKKPASKKTAKKADAADSEKKPAAKKTAKKADAAADGEKKPAAKKTAKKTEA